MTLRLDHLTKEYPTRSGPLVVVRDVSWSLNPGDAVAIMGPSGAGKSTLLYLVGTLERPTSGTIAIGGTDPFSLSEKELADFRNRQIGFVFQDHHLLPQCSVLENVLLPTLAGKPSNGATSRQQDERHARELLERVGLSARLDHRPAELSGGERQRVAVARALIRKPLLLLADEPTGNLDRRSARAVGELLLDLHRQSNTILIVVTHSLELAAMLPRRLELIDGQLQNVEGAA
jgi:lipoprotein-releasing system ATP-binding protein